MEKSLRFRDLKLVEKELSFFLERNVPQVKFIDRTFNCDRERALKIWRFLRDNAADCHPVALNGAPHPDIFSRAQKISPRLRRRSHLSMTAPFQAVNAKYIHSNLAVYSMSAYASERFACDGARPEIEIAEYTINQPVGRIITDIYMKTA